MELPRLRCVASASLFTRRKRARGDGPAFCSLSATRRANRVPSSPSTTICGEDCSDVGSDLCGLSDGDLVFAFSRTSLCALSSFPPTDSIHRGLADADADDDDDPTRSFTTSLTAPALGWTSEFPLDVGKNLRIASPRRARVLPMELSNRMSAK